jgi:site-specific recombinase XerD
MLIPPTPIFDTLLHTSIVPEERPQLDNLVFGDYLHACQFLYSYRGSEATFNAYRRELERFLQWSCLVAKKSIREIKRLDVETFVEFCQSPPLPWIGTKNVSRFIEQNGRREVNPDWRPFVITLPKNAPKNELQADPKQYQLSQKALQAIFAILGSFYNYLIQEDYIEFNPVAQIRQKSKFLRKQANKVAIRRLSELQWSYVIETARGLATETPEKHERTLFIMNALFSMYLRISELAASPRWTPQMGDFHPDIEGNWWFTTVGKGNKQLAVSDAMLEALKRYRHSLGLSLLPFPGETRPLLIKEQGKGPISSTRHIRSIVQKCFDAACLKMENDGFNEEAAQLRAATVHWLRHTGISEDVKHRPREHVRDDAGHGSSAITDRYIDIDLRERHASSRKKKIAPDD